MDWPAACVAGHLVTTLWDLTTRTIWCAGGVPSSQVKIPSVHQSTEGCRTSSLCRTHATTGQIPLRRGKPEVVDTAPKGAVHRGHTQRVPEKKMQRGTAVRPLNPRDDESIASLLKQLRSRRKSRLKHCSANQIQQRGRCTDHSEGVLLKRGVNTDQPC